LQIVHISSGPAPIVTRLSFGEGKLILSEDGGRVRCIYKPGAVARLQSSYQSQEVQSVIERIQQNPEHFHFMADARSLTVRDAREEVQIDYEAMPDAIMTFLKGVDAEFELGFGRSYRLRLAR